MIQRTEINKKEEILSNLPFLINVLTANVRYALIQIIMIPKRNMKTLTIRKYQQQQFNFASTLSITV